MKAKIIAETKEWLANFVIKHQVCPFAKQPYIADTIRYTVVESAEMEDLITAFLEEVQLLRKDATIETTLLIFPNLLPNFLDYNEALGYFEMLLEQLNLEGIFQIASFHPDYQFAGLAPDAVENYTNKSPYQLLHLLREASVEKAVENYPSPELIPERNMAKMRELFN